MVVGYAGAMAFACFAFVVLQADLARADTVFQQIYAVASASFYVILPYCLLRMAGEIVKTIEADKTDKNLLPRPPLPLAPTASVFSAPSANAPPIKRAVRINRTQETDGKRNES